MEHATQARADLDDHLQGPDDCRGYEVLDPLGQRIGRAEKLFVNGSGKFSYQLILDNGAEEALIMPTADDAKVLRDLNHDTDTLYWDLDKEIIIFGKIS